MPPPPRGMLSVGSFPGVVTTALEGHWALGFKQSRFHHGAQVCGSHCATRLRASPLFSPCSVSRPLSRSSKASDLGVMSSEPFLHRAGI